VVKLTLPGEWRVRLIDELERAGSHEIGGIVMGEQLAPGEFRIAEMTFQRRGGLVASFVRNAKWALYSLCNFFSRTEHRYQQFNYLGEWHSHPLFAPAPSKRDHATMIDLTCHGETGANFLILMIARLDASRSLEGSVTVYLPNGTVGAGILRDDESLGRRGRAIE